MNPPHRYERRRNYPYRATLLPSGISEEVVANWRLTTGRLRAPAVGRAEQAGTLNCKLTIPTAVKPARTQVVAPMPAMPQPFILSEATYGRGSARRRASLRTAEN